MKPPRLRGIAQLEGRMRRRRVRWFFSLISRPSGVRRSAAALWFAGPGRAAPARPARTCAHVCKHAASAQIRRASRPSSRLPPQLPAFAMAGKTGMKKGVRREPCIRTPPKKTRRPSKSEAALKAQEPARKVKGVKLSPFKLERNQVCLAGGCLRGKRRAITLRRDRAGKEWVALKANMEWLCAATSGRHPKRSPLKRVLLISRVQEQLLEEGASQAAAPAPAGGEPVAEPEEEEPEEEAADDDPMGALLRKRGLAQEANRPPAKKAQAKKTHNDAPKTNVVQGFVSLGSGAGVRRIEARTSRNQDRRGVKGVGEPVPGCDVLASDLPWVLELIHAEVIRLGVPDNSSDGESQDDSREALETREESCLPSPRWVDSASAWVAKGGGMSMYLQVPEKVHKMAKTPLAPYAFLRNKERARILLMRACESEAQRARGRGSFEKGQSAIASAREGGRAPAPAPAGGVDGSRSRRSRTAPAAFSEADVEIVSDD